LLMKALRIKGGGGWRVEGGGLWLGGKGSGCMEGEGCSILIDRKVEKGYCIVRDKSLARHCRLRSAPSPPVTST